MSFITEKVKESRLVLPKNISVEEEADAKEQSNSQLEYNKVCLFVELSISVQLSFLPSFSCT